MAKHPEHGSDNMLSKSALCDKFAGKRVVTAVCNSQSIKYGMFENEPMQSHCVTSKDVVG